MGDYAIQMQFDIGAEASAVRRALGTEAGIQAWWSARAELLDGRLRVWFPDQAEPFVFSVQDGADRPLDWVTGANPPWWHGTTVRWWTEPVPNGSGVRLQFRHLGFDADNPVIPVVTPAWALIIQRLKGYAETGRPDPFFAF